DLDLRYRSAAWRRPLGVKLVDQPYRLTELVFYYYVQRQEELDQQRGNEDEFILEETNGQRPYPSLARCLAGLNDHLSSEQRQLMIDTLNQLSQEERRPEYGDALGLLLRKA